MMAMPKNACIAITLSCVVQVGEDLPRLADRCLQPSLYSGQAADPGVDHAERDRGEAVGVDADVELMVVRAVIACMRVSVEERDTVVPAWAMRCVAINVLAVAGVRVVRGEEPVPVPRAFDHLRQDLPPGRLVQRCESLDGARALCCW